MPALEAKRTFDTEIKCRYTVVLYCPYKLNHQIICRLLSVVLSLCKIPIYLKNTLLCYVEFALVIADLHFFFFIAIFVIPGPSSFVFTCKRIIKEPLFPVCFN